MAAGLTAGLYMNAIECQNISKRYFVTKERPVLLKSLFLPPKKEEVWALKNVNLKIKKGETVGIIGANGSGKSTLLKIIAGITHPTTGTVKVNGRIGSLIELGAGFHPDLTGRENVHLNGALLGFTKGELDKKYDEIVDFAGIGDYISQPVRMYSSGMIVRLGFSVAAHLDPELLLLDEILAVGDLGFQDKCHAKIAEFRSRSKTIIFVSHNLFAVKALCSKVILLSSGQIVKIGQPDEVVYVYAQSNTPQEENGERQREVVEDEVDRPKRALGTEVAKITDVWTEDEQGNKTSVFERRGNIVVKVRVKFFRFTKDPIFGIVIRGSNHQTIFATNTFWKKTKTGNFLANQEVTLEHRLGNVFSQGNYSITSGVASGSSGRLYDQWINAQSFSVWSKFITRSLVDLDYNFRVHK